MEKQQLSEQELGLRRNIGQICDKILEEKRWRPFKDLDINIVQEGFPFGAYISLNDRRIHISVRKDFETLIDSMIQDEQVQISSNSAAEAVIYHLIVHEYNHHHYCPATIYLFKEIMDSISSVVEKKELTKSKIKDVSFEIHNLFSDTVINTIAANETNPVLECSKYRLGMDMASLLILYNLEKPKLLKLFSPSFDKALLLFSESNMYLCGANNDLYQKIAKHLPKSKKDESIVKELIDVFLQDKELLKRAMSRSLLEYDRKTLRTKMCDYESWPFKAGEYARIIYPYLKRKHDWLNNGFTGNSGSGNKNQGNQSGNSQGRGGYNGQNQQPGQGNQSQYSPQTNQNSSSDGSGNSQPQQNSNNQQPNGSGSGGGQSPQTSPPNSNCSSGGSGQDDPDTNNKASSGLGGSGQVGDEKDSKKSQGSGGEGKQTDKPDPKNQQSGGSNQNQSNNPSKEQDQQPNGGSANDNNQRQQQQYSAGVSEQDLKEQADKIEPAFPPSAKRFYENLRDKYDPNQKRDHSISQGSGKSFGKGIGIGSRAYNPHRYDFYELDMLYRERAGKIKLILDEPSAPHALQVWKVKQEADLSDTKKVDWSSTIIVGKERKYLSILENTFPIEIDSSVPEDIGGLPDLCFVFDSSGSMYFEPYAGLGEYHIAVLTFYSIINDLAEKGIAPLLNYNAVNFSDTTFSSGWCRYRELDKVKKTLFKHQGGGTTINIRSLEDIRLQRKDNYLLFFLSDLAISNVSQLEEELVATNEQRAAQIIVSKLGGKDINSQRLEDRGILVLYPSSIEDFMHDSIKITKDLYLGGK